MIWATALLVSGALVFLGTSVAPCLGGGVGPGGSEIRDRCVAEWEAGRSWLERFSAETPTAILVVILVAMGATAVVLWRAGRYPSRQALTADSSDLHKRG